MTPRKARLYQPGSTTPFYISRSKIALFLDCPYCFYADRRFGIARPDIPAYTLNNTVDVLLKKEFDTLREQRQPHRLMRFYRIDAIPFWHPQFHMWRDDHNKRIGAETLHEKTNLMVHGIIDDIWMANGGQDLHIVDYKATSTDYPISLDSKYKEGYKRQMEVYQWIFRRLGFTVSSMGYFLFANATRNRSEFAAKLDFETSIISYQGDTNWVEPTLIEMKRCLESDVAPEASKTCQYCAWRKALDGQKLKKQGNLI